MKPSDIQLQLFAAKFVLEESEQYINELIEAALPYFDRFEPMVKRAYGMVAEGQLEAIKKLTEKGGLTLDQAVQLVSSAQGSINNMIKKGK